MQRPLVPASPPWELLGRRLPLRSRSARPPIGTLSPFFTRIFVTLPAADDGTGTVALSVSTSTMS